MFKQAVEKKKKDKIDSEYLLRAHHLLMREYGWIPLEEFKSIPIVTILNLLNEIQKDKKDPEYKPVVVMGYAKKKGK